MRGLVAKHQPHEALEHCIRQVYAGEPCLDPPAWTLDALPGGQRLPAGVREALLQHWVTAGALQRAGQALRVHDAAVLASIACGCHAAGLQAEGA